MQQAGAGSDRETIELLSVSIAGEEGCENNALVLFRAVWKQK